LRQRPSGAAVGGPTGKFVHERVEAGIGEKMDDAPPPGSAGIIAVYDHDHAGVVDETLTKPSANRPLRSTRQREGA
jgi:hypothetical protein